MVMRVDSRIAELEAEVERVATEYGVLLAESRAEVERLREETFSAQAKFFELEKRFELQNKAINVYRKQNADKDARLRRIEEAARGVLVGEATYEELRAVLGEK